jgi:2-C-methyl-D-erythritol 4-phosphate cytidylyltransferase
MNVDAVRPLLMAQVVKSLLETTDQKDSPFSALLANAMTDKVRDDVR